MDKIISNFQPLLKYESLLAIAQHSDRALYYQLKYLPFMRRHLINQYYKKHSAQTQVECQLLSLGHFIEEHKIPAIDFLKIDVEGAEFDVIKSIRPEQFKLIKQLSIEAHDISGRVERLSDYLTEQGCTVHVVKNPMFEKLGFNHHMLYCKR